MSFVIERRAKAQLMTAQPPDNATAADQASVATSTPVTHAPAVKDSPSVTPVRSKLGAVLVAYVATCFTQLLYTGLVRCHSQWSIGHTTLCPHSSFLLCCHVRLSQDRESTSFA